MLDSFDFLRQFTLLSVMARLFFAAMAGGFIGLEREYKRRPAGFRTHILICVGACMTTMTSQFLAFAMEAPVDLSRLGAQVVAGVGFIGAGTIIVTRQQRVKGLTTAAGLWACAILGLAIGAGFFESAAVFLTLILLAEMLFVKLEYKLLRHSREHILYVEYSGSDCLDRILTWFRKADVHVSNIEITRSGGSGQTANVIFYVRLNRSTDSPKIREGLSQLSGVLSVEEV